MTKLSRKFWLFSTIALLTGVGLFFSYPKLRSLMHFQSETLKAVQEIATAKKQFKAAGTFEPPRVVHETPLEPSKLPEEMKTFLSIMGANAKLYEAEFEKQEKGLHWLQDKFPMGQCPTIRRGGRAGRMPMVEYRTSGRLTWFDFRSSTQWLMGSREQGAFGCRIEFFLRPVVQPKSGLKKTN